MWNIFFDLLVTTDQWLIPIFSIIDELRQQLSHEQCESISTLNEPGNAWRIEIGTNGYISGLITQELCSCENVKISKR